jgi:AraC-like ligand binding domain
MSIAHAVAHGAFGRACLFELDRPMVPHAHREGHLIFHVRGPVASVVVDGKTLPLTPRSATAISPWQPHYFAPIDRRESTLTLVLYIRPGWFVDASHTAFEILRFGRSTVEMAAVTARSKTGSVPSPRRLSIKPGSGRARATGRLPNARDCVISA